MKIRYLTILQIIRHHLCFRGRRFRQPPSDGDANVPSLIVIALSGRCGHQRSHLPEHPSFRSGARITHTSSKTAGEGIEVRTSATHDLADEHHDESSQARTMKRLKLAKMLMDTEAEPVLCTSLSTKTIPPSSPAPGLHGKTHCLANSIQTGERGQADLLNSIQ